MQYFITKLKDLLWVYSFCFEQISVELAECHLKSQKKWGNPHEELSDFIALLFYWLLIIVVLLFIILPIGLLFPIMLILLSCVLDLYNPLVDKVNKWINSLDKSTILPMIQLSNDDISNIIFKILQENELELELTSLDSLKDIFPVNYPMYAQINGLNYGRVIAKHKPDAKLDSSMARELLNTKILQYLQMYYPNTNYVFNGLGVITVFEIEKDAMHHNYYSFKIMYVTTEKQAVYINNLWKAEKQKQIDSKNFNLYDEDF